MRVGNAAAHQVQLDVFGPIVDLASHVADARGGSPSATSALVEEMVEAVERRWHEPDHGIWEVRRPPRHHVHSQASCAG